MHISEGGKVQISPKLELYRANQDQIRSQRPRLRRNGLFIGRKAGGGDFVVPQFLLINAYSEYSVRRWFCSLVSLLPTSPVPLLSTVSLRTSRTPIILANMSCSSSTQLTCTFLLSDYRVVISNLIQCFLLHSGTSRSFVI